MFQMTAQGIQKLQKDLDAAGKVNKKALNTALKVEGYRLLRQLRDDIKSGRPGGSPYAAELSKIASRTKSGRLRKNQVPLYRIARMLRYNASYANGELHFSFGFISKGNRPLPSGYKQMLIEHQEGIDVLYDGSRTELGRRFARIGGKLKKKGDPDAKYFFLRKTTGRKINLPKRPVINPFWEKNRPDAIRNIQVNFARKLRGERI